MRHQLIYCILSPLFVLLLITTSCTDEGSSVGKKWIDTSFTNVFTDNIDIQLSTIIADSITTSGTTSAQIGCYQDQYRGKLKTSFFTEYNLARFYLDYSTTAWFDSITVKFYPTGEFVGDTLQRQTINIHRLINNIDLDDNTHALYNTSDVAYETTPISSISFYNMPKRGRMVERRLDDALGKEFFDYILDDSPILQSQDRFRNRFPGLAFIPEENGCINGFAVNDTSMILTIYYREISGQILEKTLSFKPSSTYLFNRADHDRTNTPFESIVPVTNNTINSSLTGNMAYLQGLSGMYISIEFPTLNNILTYGDLVSIESGRLYIYPIRNAYNDMVPLPRSLTLFTANDNDMISGVITNSSGTSLENGNLQEHQDPSKSFYSFDLTSFLQSNLGTFGKNRQKLMLRLPEESFFSTAQSLILGNKNYPTNTENTVRLELIYKAYHKK